MTTKQMKPKMVLNIPTPDVAKELPSREEIDEALQPPFGNERGLRNGYYRRMLRTNLIVDARRLRHTSTSTVSRLFAMSIQNQVYRARVVVSRSQRGRKNVETWRAIESSTYWVICDYEDFAARFAGGPLRLMRENGIIRYICNAFYGRGFTAPFVAGDFFVVLAAVTRGFDLDSDFAGAL